MQVCSCISISSKVKYTVKPVLHTTVTLMNNIKLTLRVWKIIVKKHGIETDSLFLKQTDLSIKIQYNVIHISNKLTRAGGKNYFLWTILTLVSLEMIGKGAVNDM